MTREELLEQLPGDLRPWAEIWMPILLSWSEDQVTKFIRRALGGNWQSAYQMLVKGMTTEQKLAEGEIRIEALKQLNMNNAAFIRQQRSLLLEIIAKAFMALK